MFRRICLALAFVTAFGVTGIGTTDRANAHGGYYGPARGWNGPGFGGFNQGGYAAAAVRMGAYTPAYHGAYNYGPYGYPVGYGGGVPVGVNYGNSNVIIIGF
jgi:hypothetical protein